MLYDPKWEIQTKADPFKLESLIAWLEKQEAGDQYDYECNGGCLLSLYFRQMGFRLATMGSITWHYHRSEGIAVANIPDGFDNIAHRHPRTFGAALERAREKAGI